MRMGSSGGQSNRLARPPDQLRAELFLVFRRYGFLCRPRWRYQAGDGGGDMGWAVRFVLDSAGQQRGLERLLRQAGYPDYRTYRRGGRPMLSLPGRRAVEEFRASWKGFIPPTSGGEENS